MRFSSLLLFSLFTFGSLAIAQDHSQEPVQSRLQAELPPSFESFSGASPDLLTSLDSAFEEGSREPEEARVGSRRVRFYGASEIRQNLCFKMRTYIVAREARHSDRTRLVGYRTCLPGSDLEMRNADARTPR
ncbi:MAG TPA: hypothetical protein VFA89_05105 [Terriglobales bacterium]|nr:hypothetical protein [Terriglobales bacterium]